MILIWAGHVIGTTRSWALSTFCHYHTSVHSTTTTYNPPLLPLVSATATGDDHYRVAHVSLSMQSC